MLLYGPFSQIARFLSSPTKICSITFDSEEIKKIESSCYGSFSDISRDRAGRITLDLKIKNNMLYFTEHGQSRSIGNLDFYISKAYVYNTIVEKGLNDPSKITFQGSLGLSNFIKLFEITGRHLRQNLCDEQFNAIYSGMINVEHNPLVDSEKFKNSNFYTSWLSNILKVSTTYEHITRMEVELLEREGLLNEDLVLKQQDFLKGKGLYYYLFKLEEDYWKEFMVASKKKRVPRSDVMLIRNSLDGCGIDDGCMSKSLFERIFDRDKNDDLSLEF